MTNKAAIDEIKSSIQGKISTLQDQIDRLETLDASLDDFITPDKDDAVFAWQQVLVPSVPAVAKAAKAKVAIKSKKRDPIVKTITDKLYGGKKKRKYTKKAKYWAKKKK